MLKKIRDFLVNTFLDESLPKRELAGISRKIALGIGLLTTLTVMYTAFAGMLPTFQQNSLFLCPILALTFMWIPGSRRAPKDKPSVIDWMFVAGLAFCMVWTWMSSKRISGRMWLVSPVEKLDYVACVILVLASLEACRRTVGVIVCIIAVIFMVYGIFGPQMPGILMHKGMTFKVFTDNVYLTTEGLFGSLTGMTATTIFGFISFGTFLAAIKGDKSFMDIALAIAGKKPGGPAKVSVLSSGLMGMISGSSVANVVTTGSVTIPLMKSIGYKPEDAGAVEAVASSGGQIMPPVMGAGAFLMADNLGIPFFTLVKYAFLPAVLFYIVVWFYVDRIARKSGINGISETPNLKKVLIEALPVFIPIGILIVLVMQDRSAFLCGMLCTVLLYVAGMCVKDRRLSFKDTIGALESCSISMTSICGVVAVASLIVCMIQRTGLMNKFTSIILTFANGKVILLVLILLVVSLIMGMGIPVTSTYIILSSLGVAALVTLGVPDIGAHMFLFWSAMVGGLTPPVCVTAYVAAQVAKADPMKTGFASLKMGITFYLIPQLFLFTQFLTGSWPMIIWIFCINAIGMFFMVCGVEGWLVGKMSLPERIVAFGIFVAMFVASLTATPFTQSLITSIIAAAIGVVLFLFNKKKKAHSVAA